jgi:hypothetical protein
MLMRQRTYVALSSVLAAAAGAGVVLVVANVGHDSIPGRPPAIAAAPSARQPPAPGRAPRHAASPAATPAPAATQQPVLAAALQQPGSTPAAPPASTPAPPRSSSPAPSSPPATAAPAPGPASTTVPSTQPSCTVGIKVTVVSVCAQIGG